MTAAALLVEPEVSVREALAPADAHHLAWLESEAIHILREVAGQCRNPAEMACNAPVSAPIWPIWKGRLTPLIRSVKLPCLKLKVH